MFILCVYSGKSPLLNSVKSWEWDGGRVSRGSEGQRALKLCILPKRKKQQERWELTFCLWTQQHRSCEPRECNGSSSLSALLILDPTWKPYLCVYQIPETFNWGQRSDLECGDTILKARLLHWIKRRKVESHCSFLSVSYCGYHEPAITPTSHHIDQLLQAPSFTLVDSNVGVGLVCCMFGFWFLCPDLFTM